MNLKMDSGFYSMNIEKQFLQTKRSVIAAMAILLIALGMVITTKLLASGGPVITDGILYGRGVVLSDAGNPYFAEFDTDGKVVNVIGEVKDTYENAREMSAASYTITQNNYKIFREVYGQSINDDTEVLTVEAFIDQPYAPVDVLVTGQTEAVPIDVEKGEVYTSTKSVLVLKHAAINDPRLLNAEKGVILFEAPFDLNEALTLTLDPNSVSIIISKDGKFLFESENNIGYRSAFVKFDGYEGDTSRDTSSSYSRFEGDELWQGIDGTVESGLGALSASIEGRFTLYDWIPPCPGFSWFYDFDIYAGVHFRNFNPQARNPFAKHYFRGFGSAYCYGYGEVFLGASLGALSAQINAIGIGATLPANVYFSRIPVDVLMFSGLGTVRNPDETIVTLDATTSYNPDVLGYTRIYETVAEGAEAPEENEIKPEDLDLDADRQADWISDPGSVNAAGGVIGQLNLDTEAESDVHVLDPNAPLYVGVYFGTVDAGLVTTTNVPQELDADGQPVPIEPDLVRLADQNPDFIHRGLLKTITEDDLKNTDLFVYRLSNGQLITEREGLETLRREGGDGVAQESGINGGVIPSEGADDPDKFYYRIVIPGPRSGASFSGLRTEDSLADWQQNIGVSSELRGYSADSLRPGELVHVIAINRATGYIGSLKVPVSSAARNTTDETDISTAENRVNSNSYRIDIPLAEMVLEPPNLKVKVERVYDIENGLTKTQQGDDPEKYLIGSEGAGLTTDTFLAIYTEWFDQDGSLLPDDLSGYTARLAKTVGKDDSATLVNADTGSNVEFFDVKTGSNIQMVRLEGDTLGTEHFYLHVHGTNNDGRVDGTLPSFDAGSGEEILEKRPEKYTPVLVPVYDELATRRAKNNATYQLQDETEENPYLGPKASEIDPVYRWSYRPEMQFSVFELNVSEISRTDAYGDEFEIFGLDAPVIGTSDDIVELLYDLLENDQNGPLDYFGPGSDLMFTLGGYEVSPSFGNQQTTEYFDLGYLSQIDASDLLSIRLVQNSDPDNVLWQWAFIPLSITVFQEDDVFIDDNISYVSADLAKVELSATLIGYDYLEDEKKDDFPEYMDWKVISGNAQFSPSRIEINDGGFTVSELSLDPIAGNKAVIHTRLLGDNPVPVRYEVEVIAGKPAVISLTESGTSFLKGVGITTVTAVLHDKNGNLVEDGTPVHFREKGHIELVSYEAMTLDGKATAKIKGGSVAGYYEYKATSGLASSSGTISVQPLQIEFLGVPEFMFPQQSYELKARLSGGSGDLSGIFVDLGVDKGIISSRDTVTDSAGEVNFTYRAPSQIGSYSLGAKVDVNNPIIQPITVAQVVSAPENPVNAQQYFLVAGTGDSANETIEHYSGQVKTFEYPIQNKLVLKGTENEVWSSDLDDDHLVNRQPLYFNRFKSLIRDDIANALSHFENVNRLRSKLPGFYDLGFTYDGTDATNVLQSKWSIPSLPQAEIQNPAYSFWLNPLVEGSVMNVADGTLILKYDGLHLVATLNTEFLNADSVMQTEIVTLNLPVVGNTWQSVALGVKENEFYLSVGNDRASSSFAGEISYADVTGGDDVWLTLGNFESQKSFTGKLTGLRIYDWGSEPLINLSSENGVFDSSGETELLMNLSENFKNTPLAISGVSVGIASSLTDSPTVINILNVDTLSDFAKSFLSVNDQSQVSSGELLQEMPMNELFPDPAIGSSSIMQRSVVIPTRDISVNEAIASISWLGFNSRFGSLESKVNTLQKYFSDTGSTNLSIYLADLLQESTIKASQGDELLVRALSTSFTVWTEVIEIDSTLANLIASSIENRTDLGTWIRILSLPANGWAADVIPYPRPEMTCDLVTPDVNVGTLYEFSSTPCRATGQQMVDFLNTFREVEEQIDTSPPLFTLYLTTLLSALEKTSLEYRFLFPTAEDYAFSAKLNTENKLFPDAQAAGPLVYVVRGLAIAIKQSIRAASSAAPGNFVAFLQGGTTSRVKTLEMLASLAYLGSRLDAAPDCGNCKKLNPQVSDRVQGNMTAWFTGMGLAHKGTLASETGTVDKKCTLTRYVHGNAFELVAAAAYHGLYEFGGAVGLSSSDKYEILLHDPRKDEDSLYVPIMKKKRRGNNLEHFAGSDKAFLRKGYFGHFRVPDLVLKGDGNKKRTWVELKSWSFNAKTAVGGASRLARAKKLDKDNYPDWNGQTNATDTKRFTAKAQRQKFLDYSATLDTLNADFWEKSNDNDGKVNNKPNKGVTWFQVWEPEKRTWRRLRKDRSTKKYKLESKANATGVANVATPWIDKDDIKNGLVIGASKKFKLLQKYIVEPPSLKNEIFEATVGMTKSEYNSDYAKQQITNNPLDYRNSSVRPFTVGSFIVYEGSEAIKVALMAKLNGQFAGSKLGKINKALQDNTLSDEVIEEFKELITDEMLGILGPLRALAVEIPLLSYVENKVADAIIGDSLEDIVKSAAEIELPEFIFDGACE